MRSKIRNCSALADNRGGNVRPQARHSSMAPVLSMVAICRQSQIDDQVQAGQGSSTGARHRHLDLGDVFANH